LLASLPTSPRVAQSVYDCGWERHHPRITRPKVLLVVGHPSIGAALEALLRIEDRYEVRRAQSLEQVASGLDGWSADLALVDGVLVPKGRIEVLPMPTIVLSGNPHDGRRLAERFAQGRGWLRKDATAEEIRAAIDRALNQMQMSTSALIALAALLLWLVLRGVYVRSSRQIMSQSHALGAALAETERTYDTTLQALSNALDVRDSETEGHSRRVVEYMELIIAQLPVVPDHLATLRRGALLHDIGKIGVPDNVLRKPAALSEAEWVVMKRHPEHGARIISKIPFLEDVSRTLSFVVCRFRCVEETVTGNARCL